MRVCALSDYVMFCHVWLLALFSDGEWKGSGSGGERRCGIGGKIRSGESRNRGQDVLCERRIYFQCEKSP